MTLAKKPIHLATWRHPATKEMHMIDYIVMWSNQRMFCTDVQVMRGGTCWTDHRMIREVEGGSSLEEEEGANSTHSSPQPP